MGVDVATTSGHRSAAEAFKVPRQIMPAGLEGGGQIWEDGVRADTSTQREQFLRNNREQLWAVSPSVAERAQKQWLDFLHKHVRKDASCCIDLPSVETILRCIEAMPGTSPGEDGIPYSFWKLHAVGVATVFHAVFQLLAAVPWWVDDATPTLVQMLVFIPRPQGRRALKK